VKPIGSACICLLSINGLVDNVNILLCKYILTYTPMDTYMDTHKLAETYRHVLA
jgi:hypothetical protein